MSHRPWPENAVPTPEQLLEWCRTGMTADVLPSLQRLLDNDQAMTRVQSLRERWLETARYGSWTTARDYEHRATQLRQAIDGSLTPVVVPAPDERDQA